jgi:predicted nucleic acid-binding protein
LLYYFNEHRSIRHTSQKTYGRIVTTKEIAIEYGEPLPEWIEISSPSDKTRQQILELQLDTGEASAIALALEILESIIILDDYRARQIANRLGLNVTGTLGILIKAKRQGVIASIKPLIVKLKENHFHLSPELEQAVLNEAGE